MEITVTGRKMPITDALRSYAEEKGYGYPSVDC